MKKTLTLSILAMQAAFAGSLSAQPGWLNSSADTMAGEFMKQEDKNGDGRVTAEEFQGPKSDFAFFDKNGDNVIEQAEAPTPDNLPPSLATGNKAKGKKGPGIASSSGIPVDTVIINGTEFKLYKKYDFFTWDTLPADVRYERMPIREFTSPRGKTHYYELVSLPSGNLNWFQAASLAEDAGGYLACPTSDEENDFLFNLVNDDKYFWKFPKYNGDPAHMNHYEIKIGPFLGGYQPEGSPEPAGGWQWLSGEPWQYANWAVNLNDGVTDKDPRDNTQPNDSGNSAVGQRILGFGEMNTPVPTWGDYMDDVGTYGVERSPGRSFAFIIEYETNPKR